MGDARRSELDRAGDEQGEDPALRAAAEGTEKLMAVVLEALGGVVVRANNATGHRGRGVEGKLVGYTFQTSESDQVEVEGIGGWFVFELCLRWAS
jgi:hypothetical protein